MFPLSAQNNFYITLSSYLEGHVKKKTYGTLNMFPLSAQNNFCIMLSSYLEGHVKKKKNESEFHVFSWFPGLQNWDVFYKKKM